MKFTHTKYGIAHDPRGAHVTLHYRNVTLLGEVYALYRNPVTGAIHLVVQHFNGEPWPIQPTSWAVDVLERRP